MSNDKLRRRIAYEAARLMYHSQETDAYRAKLKAGRRLGLRWVHPGDMPTDQDVREEIHALARIELPVRPGDSPANGQSPTVDRFDVYRSLLAPLETVQQNAERHPEGDALYHSLQVYTLAREALPYDEEFQLAALLHDVGKAIDPRNHVAAALTALNGSITERTHWLIEHHSEAGALREGTLGMRARKRLEASPDYDDLMLLCDFDRQGRQRGAEVPDVEEALDDLRALAGEDEPA